MIALGRIVDVVLSDGRRFHPVLHWIVTNQSAGSYEQLHWSIPPTMQETMEMPDGVRGRLGPTIQSISYIARKGSKNAVFEHQFEVHEIAGSEWQARIIWLPGATAYRKTGRRAATVRTNSRAKNGGPVVVASSVGRPTFAIETQRSSGNMYPYMTPHGIEG